MVDFRQERRTYQTYHLYPCYYSFRYRFRLGGFGLGVTVQKTLSAISGIQEFSYDREVRKEISLRASFYTKTTIYCVS